MANATPKDTTPKPVVIAETFDAPKTRTSGPPKTKAEMLVIRKAAGKKAAAARKAKLYTVKVKNADGTITEQTVNGSQLAGMRAAVARNAAKAAKKG
jgi:hypothetical protein